MAQIYIVIIIETGYIGQAKKHGNHTKNYRKMVFFVV